MPKGPCIVCGKTDYPLSCGGPDICPSCDCGQFDGHVLAKHNADLQTRLTACERELEAARERMSELECMLNAAWTPVTKMKEPAYDLLADAIIKFLQQASGYAFKPINLIAIDIKDARTLVNFIRLVGLDNTTQDEYEAYQRTKKSIAAYDKAKEPQNADQ